MLLAKPMYTDNATCDRKSYARCFVEVNAKKPLPDHIHISVEVEQQESSKIQVIYEWLPSKCSKCSSFGHVDKQCHVQMKWKEKTSL